MSTPTGSTTPNHAANTAPAASQDVDLGAQFPDLGPGADGGTVEFDQGGISGHSAFQLGGGLEGSFTMEGGVPQINLGASGNLGADNGFNIEGTHEHVDPSGVNTGLPDLSDSSAQSGANSGSDAATEHASSSVETSHADSASVAPTAGGAGSDTVEFDQGGISGHSAFQLGGGLEGSFTMVDGVPLIGGGADGYLGADNSFDIEGTHEHVDPVDEHHDGAGWGSSGGHDGHF